MASYSATGNRHSEKINGITYAWRAWASYTTTDYPTYVKVTYNEYLTAGRTGTSSYMRISGTYTATRNGSTATNSTTWGVNSGSDDILVFSSSVNISKGTSAKSAVFSVKYYSDGNLDFPSGTSSGSVSIPIPALAKYNVTFNANGHGTAPATQSIFYGYKASQPTNPSATGWTFGGWYRNSACTGNAWNFSTDTVTATTTLYAKWTVNTYTVSYNNNGGTGTIASQSKAYNAAITLANNSNNAMTRKDTLNGAVREWIIKTTGGWNTNSGGTGTAYNLGATMAANTISADTPLFAQWIPKYIYPTVTELNAIRTATVFDTDEVDDAEYLYITFNWTGYSRDADSSTPTFSVPVCNIVVDNVTYSVTLASGTSTFAFRPFKASTDTTVIEGKTYYIRSETQPASEEYVFINPYYYTVIDPPPMADPSQDGYFEFLKFSQDTVHSVYVEAYDSNYTTHKSTASITVPTAILPIDLYGSGNDVYMGIMHPYEEGTPLVMPDVKVDGNVKMTLDTTSASGTDHDLYVAIVALGWQNDVIV